MKKRFYARMTIVGLEEIDYEKTHGHKITHRYQSPDCEVHVIGTFKASMMSRQSLDYSVMLLLQSKGLKVGKLYHE